MVATRSPSAISSSMGYLEIRQRSTDAAEELLDPSRRKKAIPILVAMEHVALREQRINDGKIAATHTFLKDTTHQRLVLLRRHGVTPYALWDRGNRPRGRHSCYCLGSDAHRS